MESVYSIALKIHLAIFLLLNLILFLIDFVTGDGWWFYWITAVWSIALFFQAFVSLKMIRKTGEAIGSDNINVKSVEPTDEDFWKLEDRKSLFR